MSKEVWEKAKAIIGTHHKLELAILQLWGPK